MLKALPKTHRPVISLIPYSGIQFVDYGFDIDRTPKLTRYFWEEKRQDESAEEGMMAVDLRSLRPNPETNELVDPATGEAPPQEEVYSFNKIKGLESFLDKWVPVPFLRLKGRDGDGNPLYDSGPTNWARARVVELPERDADGHSHRVVMAFDTEVRERHPDRPYLIPTPQDSEEEQEFCFVESEQDNG